MDVASRGVSAIVEYDYEAKEPDELDLVKGALIHNIKQMPGGWWEGTLQSNGKIGMFPDNFVRIIDNSDENKITMREKSATANRRCKVIFSYTQVNDDELSLAVGDVIEFLGEVEEGWWRGRLKSKVGVFPSNFVTVIEPSPIFASKRPAVGPGAATSIAAKSAVTTTTASVEKSTVGASSSITSSTSTATATSSTTKKMNRISFHSSKEDLLNSSSVSSNSGATSTSNVAVDEIAPSLPPKPQREYCRVEFPYTPQNDDELELKVGEIITIISMELPDKGWWKGELHGKVGVFPDNFVKLLEADAVPERSSIEILGSRMANFINTFIFTSLSDSQHPQRTAKATNATATANANTAQQLKSATGAAATSAAAHSTAATSKVFIKKSGSNSSTQSSNRLQSGNVAAQRKSLENKNLDLTANAADASSRLALKKQQLQQQQQQQQQHSQETKTILTNNGSITTTTTTTSSMSSSSAAVTNELRKSLESLDEKTKTPPPVLTKKPTVTTKKPSSVSGVASNLFGFGKQKTKGTDSKLTTAASQDFADGMGSSKMSASSHGEAVVMRRAATIAVEDSDFDRLERASILPDMRAGRVKAPKRRPPSAAINIIGESNNNNTIYLNGSSSGGGASGGELSQEEGKLHSSDDNSTGEEPLAKPKPREWEKKKAPWMEELKATQVKKKTSPSVEPRTQAPTSASADRTSRLLGDDVKVTNSSHNFASSTANTASASHSSSSHSSSSNTASSSSTTTTKVQSSSSVTSSVMQQSMTVESSQQLLKKELNSNTIADIMTKSMSNKFTTDSSLTAATTAAPSAVEDVRIRPNSLSIRNRSMSPSLLDSGSSGGGARTTAMKSNTTPAPTVVSEPSSNGIAPSAATSATLAAATTAATAASSQNSIGANNHYQPRTSNTAAPVGGDNTRIGELERRVGKLELTVVSQQRTIDELMRLLREETDRVKVLRGELDKYAQQQQATRRGKFDNWMF
ncbi:serine-rich adhesin for platelets isoform X3 [Bactrocera tryoni]|uniref:serine-rich adhesin for platelets isoform X3 n=1 Tax=Bactrocera tryoni TaxID=59916 RepID=UPI001A96D8A9|nr:serine-rich adhesin for platelets isoform X3 [Bactrocera tryoni]